MLTGTSESMERYKDKLLVSSSILTPLSDLADLSGASNFVPSGALVKASYLAAPQSVKAFTVSSKAPAFNILFITKPGGLTTSARNSSNHASDAAVITAGGVADGTATLSS